MCTQDVLVYDHKHIVYRRYDTKECRSEDVPEDSNYYNNKRIHISGLPASQW